MINAKENLIGEIHEKNILSGEVNVSKEFISPPLIDLEITPTKEKQVFNHENSYGYDKVTVNVINLQDKEVTPTKEQQNITSDENYDGLNKITVNPIPNEYLIPTGTIEITENGEHNVKDYEKVITDIHEVSKYAPKFISFYKCNEKDLSEEIANLDTRNLKTMNDMFYYCSVLETLDLSGFDTSKITTMANMFYYCMTLTSINLSSFDTKSVLKMNAMFYYCEKLTSLDLSNFNTSNVNSMASMFDHCKKLTSLDLSNFDTSNVTSMNNMFASCEKIEKIDLSNFNTSKVTDMNGMFRYMSLLTEIDLSNFDTSKVTNNAGMFLYCTKLKKLIINNPNVFKMTNKNMLQYTPIANGNGYVYVPDDLVETYKADTEWSNYADQIKGISELPVE